MTPPNAAGDHPREAGSPELSVVIPLYNEQENLPDLHRRLTESLTALGVSYEVVLVNDGSRDATPRLMEELQERDGRVAAVHLSRNFGHQAAVCAGLDHARGQAVVVMDGDLQDPPEVLEHYVRVWRQGYDVVYAVRTRRKEGLVKRACYAAFYRLLHAVSDIDIPLDSGDFCLMDRQVVEALKALPERSRFVRGLRSFVGFRQIGIAYERAARHAGEPKYTFKKLVGLALDGFVNFSSCPLQLAAYLGAGAAGLATLLTGGLAVAAVRGGAAPGWAWVVAAVLFMGAVQLLCLAILGQYVQRIFVESKGRPTYIASRVRPSGEVGEVGEAVRTQRAA